MSDQWLIEHYLSSEMESEASGIHMRASLIGIS